MSSLDEFSKITGFSKPLMDEVWQEVKANTAILNGCSKPHDFSICLDRHTKQVIENPTPMQHFGAKWKCSKCGGIVDNLRKMHYNEGLKDAKL